MAERWERACWRHGIAQETLAGNKCHYQPLEPLGKWQHSPLTDMPIAQLRCSEKIHLHKTRQTPLPLETLLPHTGAFRQGTQNSGAGQGRGKRSRPLCQDFNRLALLPRAQRVCSPSCLLMPPFRVSGFGHLPSGLPSAETCLTTGTQEAASD